MFNVSENYKTQVRKAVKVRNLHGILANIPYIANIVSAKPFKYFFIKLSP